MITQDQTSTTRPWSTVTVARAVQLAGALLLGAVILYGVGFVETSAVHNAAHDTRHAVGFPCH